MSNGPLELRFYMRAFTLQDAEQGVNPIRDQIGPQIARLYMPPLLQFRYKTKAGWSEWETVPVVKEGGESGAEPESTQE